MDQLRRYFEGQIADVMSDGDDDDAAAAVGVSGAGYNRSAAPAAAAAGGGGLLSEELKPRAGLPPLLVNLADRPAERLHYLGVSFGLTQQLYSFWRRSAFEPVYVRQTPSDVTGACVCVCLA